jgi:hypothetical protein
MKTKTTLSGLILLTAVLFLSGCYKPWHSIDGNRDVKSETRLLPDFHRVFNEGDFDVYIIRDGLSEVTIEAESNLIPMIRTRIEGSSLVIDTKDNLRNHYPMKVYVHTAELTEVGLSGSGFIETEEITAEDFEISLSGSGYIYSSVTADYIDCDISGSGDIELKDIDCNKIDARISGSGEMEFEGQANFGELTISGSGDIRAYDLILQDCDATISGSGNIYITVEDHLDATISGSGSIYYLGTPVINTHISGSGSVIHP